MSTIPNALDQLDGRRDELAANLTAMGVPSDSADTLSALIPRVLDIPAGGGAATVYSTDEVDTGNVWMDGKPIYRRVFTGVASGTANNITDTTISGTANIDALVDYGGWWSTGDGGKYGITGARGTMTMASLSVGASGIVLSTRHSAARTNAPYELWVEYTKV